MAGVLRIAPDVPPGSPLDRTLVCFVLVDREGRHAFCSRCGAAPARGLRGSCRAEAAANAGPRGVCCPEAVAAAPGQPRTASRACVGDGS
jgi:hypothetical protein